MSRLLRCAPAVILVLGLILPSFAAANQHTTLWQTAPPAVLGEGQPSTLGTYFIVPRHIKFTGSYSYPLSHRGSIIAEPEWSVDAYGRVLKNEPTCYKEYTTASFQVDIESASPVPPGGLQLKISCGGHNASTGVSLFPTTEKIVTVTSWGTEDYANLTWTATLPNYVTKYPLHMLFYFYVNQGGTWVWQNQYESGTHYLYTTMATPLSPMSYPWVEVIDLAATFCSGASSTGTVGDECARDLYGSIWTYEPGITHTARSTSNPLDQYFDLAGFLDDIGQMGDCKDFGNLYALLMRSLGVDGRAYFVDGPFDPKPILGANTAMWTDYPRLVHHQFGWHSSQVHDAAIKVNQAAPLYAINMDRDTTYKGYLYQSGDWFPKGSVICKLGQPPGGGDPWPTGLTPGVALETASSLGLTYVASGNSTWATPNTLAQAITQRWRLPDGSELILKLAAFPTDMEAREASLAEAEWSELSPELGSYSGAPLGDCCWFWPSGRNVRRLVIQSGRYAISALLVGNNLDRHAGLWLEELVRAGLRHIIP